MIVTELAEVGKNKYKVYIDYEYAFLLSAKEVKLYEMEEGHQVTDVLYSEILNEVILPKAKRKAMDLLKSMDRTEYELLAKMRTAGFSEAVCQDALAYVKSFNYVNDYRYACNYINYRKATRSLKMLQMELSKKGVDKTLIDQAFEEEYQDTAEEEAVRREVMKKCKSIDDLTYEKRMKLSAALYRKGYNSSVVRKVLGDLSFYDEL